MRIAESLGKMAVICGDKAELIEVDEIRLISIVINGLTGVAQFALAFGGTDSVGTFHMDPHRASEVAHITISREGQPGLFDGLFRDSDGAPKMHYPSEFFDRLCCDVLFPAAHKMIWGGKYPDMSILHQGERRAG